MRPGFLETWSAKGNQLSGVLPGQEGATQGDRRKCGEPDLVSGAGLDNSVTWRGVSWNKIDKEGTRSVFQEKKGPKASGNKWEGRTEEASRGLTCRTFLLLKISDLALSYENFETQ